MVKKITYYIIDLLTNEKKVWNTMANYYMATTKNSIEFTH